MLEGRATLQLIRIDACAVIFLSIFLPVFARTQDFCGSFTKAAPMFLVGACTWIANDLNDIERDRVNHPDRPIPSGRITPEAAAALYFGCLASALLITHTYIPASVALLYYLVLTLALSYGYVVDLFPSFKAAYVGAAMSIPVAIVARYSPADHGLCYVGVATFCYAFGKELCMDILDRPGDTPSLLHRISQVRIAQVAFGLQFIGLLLLTVRAISPRDFMYWVIMTGVHIAGVASWFALRKFRLAVALVRLQLLLGVYFLA